jgi:peptidoglycan/xylan/chitin deacetylase (PgdA/CDA1 family)
VDHADLATLDPDSEWWEIATNKAWLEGITGVPVTCFAYPYGSYGADTAGIVAAAGYAIAFDAWGGVQPFDGSLDRWHILRIDAPSYPSAADLAWVLGG